MKRLLLFILFPFMAAPALSQIQENLLVHYTFDGNTLDQSENAYHGFPNEITYTEDRFGNPDGAALFNGINSFIDLPNLAELKPTLPVTFAFWIRLDSDDWEYREVFNTSHQLGVCSGIYFNTEISSGKFGINFGDGSPTYAPYVRRSLISNKVAVRGEWVHITAVVISATEMTIAINCKDEGGIYTGSGGDLAYSDTPGSIGRNDRSPNAPVYYFKGAIDDFLYWDRALSTIEIGSLCRSLGTTSENNLTNFSMHPNPASTKVYFSSVETTRSTVTIFDSLGNPVLKSNMKPEIDIDNLSNGIYFVTVSNEDATITKKLVKN